MIGKVVWFALGAGFGVWALGKARGYLRQATPDVVGRRVTASLGGVGDSARDFVDRVRAASAEREAELRSALREPTGSDALGLPQHPTPPAA